MTQSSSVREEKFIKNFWDDDFFSDCPLDPEDWFDMFPFTLHTGNGKAKGTRSVWRAYNVQKRKECPKSLVEALEILRQPSLSMFINVEDGITHGLESHVDGMTVFSFGILGRYEWVTQTLDGEVVKKYIIEPGDLFINAPSIRHYVEILDFPRISFGAHEPNYK